MPATGITDDHPAHPVVAAFPATCNDILDVVAMHVRAYGDATGETVSDVQRDRFASRFATVFSTPHTWMLILTISGDRAGWALLSGNVLLRLVVMAEWRETYPQILAAVQSAADKCLRDYPFDVLEATVSEFHRPIFTVSGWRRTGNALENAAVCDVPANCPPNVPACTMTRVIDRRPSGL